MTQAQLISALMEECRTEHGKIEDFLLALGDIALASLKRDNYFTLRRIGRVELAKRGDGHQLRFRPAAEISNGLGLPEVFDRGPLCMTCKEKPRRPRRKLCAACEHKSRRNRDRECGK